MPDLLVRLYALPAPPEHLEPGYSVRRAAAYDKSKVVDWVGRNFSERWASEADIAFSRRPISCFIALHEEELVGFACYEATCRGYFGPTGVLQTQRRRGLGTWLLLKSLYGMKEIGYAYAVIGGAGAETKGFYLRASGAVEIPDSTPGIYTRPLKS